MAAEWKQPSWPPAVFVLMEETRMPRSLNLAISLFYLASSAPMVLAQSNKDKDEPTAKRRIMSWTADRREYAVGDVITVLVSEATLATATKSQTGTDQQT